MVNDISILVRQKAFQTLSKFKKVDSKFLMQTFSKQVMSNLKRPLNNRNISAKRNKAMNSTQKVDKSSHGADQLVDFESDEFKLLNSGAAGAFVHGLEDEFQEVRISAIDSIYVLSKQNTEFASKSVDFLIDLFNDSSDIVRLKAIQVLRSIGKNITIGLTNEQLSICISMIEDADLAIRKSLYSFLS
ncbi:hypothetical protein BB561_001477 [Smittium simulii]|uniref:Condensin complex subunit 1 C-terminal domain-containing protein n=1 Tax=Smittium simulii TaxID=133385 RepID=A0A2T9YUG2_9FUNG|nr:hypothetical protein BB561_001477 [Smittium simulii]